MQSLILITFTWRSETANISAIEVRRHLNNNYENHVNFFTDNSVLDSLENLAECLIPDVKVQKSFSFGKGFSILTSELFETLMASNYVCNIQLTIYHFLICVDSKSALYTLQNWDCKVRRDIVHTGSCLGVLGLHFVGYHLIVVFTGIKYQKDHLYKGQWKTCLKYHAITYYFHLMRFLQCLKTLCILNSKKVNLWYLLVQSI